MHSAMMHCTENITDSFFRNGNVFVFALVIVSINPSTPLACSDYTIIYYSHKSPTLGKHSVQKKVINARIYLNGAYH